MTAVVTLIILILIAAVIVKNVRIVPQSTVFVIERLGAFKEVWEVGLHFKMPFIETVAKKVNMKEQFADFPPQPVITKDNVTMQIDTVVYFQISDAAAYAYGVTNPMVAIENLTATTLRNLIGAMELDESLTSRDHINEKMRIILDEATDPWGIKINRVELKNIIPPKDIQESMEKQMRAERERREAILRAEGQKKSQVLIAEGEKESAILKAEAEKATALLKAEADREAAIMRATGEAEAILKVQEATAEGLKKIKEVGFDDGLIRYESLKTLRDMSNGQATKIVIPSELQGLAGTLTGLSEAVRPPEPRPPHGLGPNGPKQPEDRPQGSKPQGNGNKVNLNKSVFE